MTVYCPECDQAVTLPSERVNLGIAKVRCPHCATRFEVFPGGATGTLSSTGSGGTLDAGGHTPANAPGHQGASPGFQAPNLSGHVGGGAWDVGNAAGLLDAPDLPLGTLFRGKYRIDDEIGRGGSAIVYRAHDIDAEIDRALKVVGAVGGGADGIRRAWAEEYKARLKVADGTHLLALESPLVEEIEGTTYVALPQELGTLTLRAWLDEARGEIDKHRDDALLLFAQVCRGVEALHERGLAHLDLKPENILLIEQGEAWTAKVGDFGLSRAVGGGARREGVGTPAYMAPEQVRSAREKDIGPWSDIYALGCILFELLDGDRPFSGTAEELKDKHLNMPPPELEGVPAHLEDLVTACLAKQRKARLETVAELRRGVETDPAEEAAFKQAQQTATIAGWQKFLDGWGGGRHGEVAWEALRQLELELEREEKARQEREAREREERERKERERKERERREREETARRAAASRARQQADEARRREQRRILDPVDIHGWDADRVQARQRRQAEALGQSVAFRDELADGSAGPEMVLIPSGIYTMGSPAEEPERHDDEGPYHRVTIPKPFAIGRYALTFAEWDAYAAATGGYRPEDNGWGRGARPVIEVSWEDAQRYLRWLADQTNSDYRLPSEAEWEYACRAGTTTPFHTGDRITADQANFNGNVNRTVTVGSYGANAFGLHEMHGNVWERVADCWNDSYIGAPTDGSAWMQGNCSCAVLRGGSWGSDGVFLRSANRWGGTRGNRIDGCRVARSVAL